MWPFRKKREIPFAEDLTAAEHTWLEKQREGLADLATIAGVSPADTLAAADELIRWWHSLSEEDRPDPNVIVNAAGVALGDAFAAETGLEWKVITDAFGTTIGLWQEPGKIILAPTNSVAKKFAGNPDGFVAALFRVMLPDVKRMQQELGGR